MTTCGIVVAGHWAFRKSRRRPTARSDGWSTSRNPCPASRARACRPRHLGRPPRSGVRPKSASVSSSAEVPLCSGGVHRLQRRQVYNRCLAKVTEAHRLNRVGLPIASRRSRRAPHPAGAALTSLNCENAATPASSRCRSISSRSFRQSPFKPHPSLRHHEEEFPHWAIWTRALMSHSRLRLRRCCRRPSCPPLDRGSCLSYP